MSENNYPEDVVASMELVQLDDASNSVTLVRYRDRSFSVKTENGQHVKLAMWQRKMLQQFMFSDYDHTVDATYEDTPGIPMPGHY